MEIIKIIWDSWFYTWLLIVPAVIFSVTPIAPLWLKSLRIVFLIAIFEFVRYAGFNFDPTFHTKNVVYFSQFDFYLDVATFVIWPLALVNMYVGWWEFLWRCIYRQWSKGFKSNLQYGLFSNLCIAGSLLLTLTLLSIALFLYVALNFFYEQ